VNTFLSANQEATFERYKEFALKNVEPKANDLVAQKLSLREFLGQLGELGYLGLTIPAEYSGQARPFLDLSLFIEAISGYEPGLSLSLAGHVAAIELIKKYGSESQKARYLPVLGRGHSIAAIAFAELNAGTDFQAVESTAKLNGAGYELNGKKTSVVNGDIASVAVVLAKSPDEPGKLLLLLCDLDAKAKVKISPNKPRLGLNSAHVNDLEFSSFAVASENLLPAPNDAQEQVLYAFDVAQVILAASAVGMASGALQQAVVHAKTREQFGKNIGQFQGVQWKLADMATETQGARLQTLRAAWAKDESPAEFRLYSAMCKWYAAKTARFHIGEAIQILGSFGLDADLAIARFYGDGKVMEVAEGTSEFQKMTIVKELGI
jgi:alkylation response protein AidB-like acyl-CoA dehydrogenase